MDNEYSQMRVSDLREAAKQRGLKAAYRYKKSELIAWLTTNTEKKDEAVRIEKMEKKDKVFSTEESPALTRVEKAPDENVSDANTPQTNMPESNEPESNTPGSNEAKSNESETNEPEQNEPETKAPRTKMSRQKAASAKAAKEKAAQKKAPQKKAAKTSRTKTGKSTTSKHSRTESDGSKPNDRRAPSKSKKSSAPSRSGRTKRSESTGGSKTVARSESDSKASEKSQDLAETFDKEPQGILPAPNECEVEEVLPENEPSLPSATGTLQVMVDGYGFLNCEMDGKKVDYYVPPSHIRRFHLRSGDIVEGIVGDKHDKDRYAPVIFVNSVNGADPMAFRNRQNFDELTPIYPNERIRLERNGSDVSNRVVDLVAPIGKGQRGLIVSPPKAGKTTLLKAIAQSVEQNHPEVYLFILLVDERPEEVTDFERSVNLLRKEDDPVSTEVIASTFDKQATNHTQTCEALLDRAKRLVESGQDVMILLDSLTRLSRAYNITTPPSGRTLSGGLDPVAMYPPKRFFGAARNIDGPGSLTILATCLKDTGSRMDDMIYEEFKGTGNMEVHLSRDLSELRIFPAIDIFASGTRRDDLLLSEEEEETMARIRRQNRGEKDADTVNQFIKLLRNTADNHSFCSLILSSAMK